MALFTDGLLSTFDDLRNYENQILEVATAEGIDLLSKSRVAQDMIGSEVSTILGRNSNAWPSQQFTLSNVAVTEPLRQWHVFQTLFLTFEDVYGNQLSERFKHKSGEYRRLAAWASDILLQAGIGLVRLPIPKAGRPEVTAVEAATAGSTLVVRVSWVAISGGIEGYPSDTLTINLPPGKTLLVGTNSAPPTITGWNVFVGLSADEITRQNELPLPISSTWQLPADGLRDGPRAGHGQSADWYIRAEQVLHRG